MKEEAGQTAIYAPDRLEKSPLRLSREKQKRAPLQLTALSMRTAKAQAPLFSASATRWWRRVLLLQVLLLLGMPLLHLLGLLLMALLHLLIAAGVGILFCELLMLLVLLLLQLLPFAFLFRG